MSLARGARSSCETSAEKRRSCRRLAEIRSSQLKVIACELRAGGLVTLDEGATYARRHGAWGVCPELVEMDDVPKELKALAPALAV